jgi:hypothetical protein
MQIHASCHLASTFRVHESCQLGRVAVKYSDTTRLINLVGVSIKKHLIYYYKFNHDL